MLKTWIDRHLLEFSEWLWVRVPTKGHFASASDGLVGGPRGMHLPKERITNDPARVVTESAGSLGNVATVVGAVTVAVVTGSEVKAQWSFGNCPDPYCYAHGIPCAYCGGSQTSCPAGTYQGWYWPGCCTGMTPPTSVFFYDCCGHLGTSICAPGSPVCTNANEHGWCSQDGIHCPPDGCTYVCTLAVPVGPCTPDEPGGIYS
jgi:hypothetical protein